MVSKNEDILNNCCRLTQSNLELISLQTSDFDFPRERHLKKTRQGKTLFCPLCFFLSPPTVTLQICREQNGISPPISPQISPPKSFSKNPHSENAIFLPAFLFFFSARNDSNLLGPK
jgi:hypothetical protein